MVRLLTCLFTSEFISMSNPTPSNILFSTRYKYFLNYDTGSGSLVVPATNSLTAVNMGNITIPIDSADNFSQVQINFSTSASDWYKFPVKDITIDSNYRIATVGSRASGNITLTFFLVNYTGVAVNSTACTITANAYLFETPS